jgi:hypothetical protein
MSIFEIQTIDSAPEGSKAPLEKLQQTFGMVPNVAGVIANSPVLANIFVPLFQGVHSGTFTEPEIQTLLLTNAVTNSSAWAVAFHSYLALKAGLTPADVQALRERRARRRSTSCPGSAPSRWTNASWWRGTGSSPLASRLESTAPFGSPPRCAASPPPSASSSTSPMRQNRLFRAGRPARRPPKSWMRRVEMWPG